MGTPGEDNTDRYSGAEGGKKPTGNLNKTGIGIKMDTRTHRASRMLQRVI